MASTIRTATYVPDMVCHASETTLPPLRYTLVPINPNVRWVCFRSSGGVRWLNLYFLRFRSPWRTDTRTFAAGHGWGAGFGQWPISLGGCFRFCLGKPFLFPFHKVLSVAVAFLWGGNWPINEIKIYWPCLIWRFDTYFMPPKWNRIMKLYKILQSYFLNQYYMVK